MATEIYSGSLKVKKVELLKHSKINKTVPTCFGLQGNHHQGATVSTWLKITTWLHIYPHTVQDIHALQVTICSQSTDDALHIFYADTVNQMCNF